MHLNASFLDRFQRQCRTTSNSQLIINSKTLCWYGLFQFGKQLFKCLCVIQTSPHPWCVSPLHLHIAAGHYSNSTVRRVEQNTCSNLLRPGIWRSCCCFDSMGAFTKLVDHICKSTLALHPGVRTHTHTHTHTHTCRRETGREGRRERGREGRREDNLKSCRLVCRRNVLLVNLQRRPQSPSFLRRCKKNLTQHAHAP